MSSNIQQVNEKKHFENLTEFFNKKNNDEIYFNKLSNFINVIIDNILKTNDYINSSIDRPLSKNSEVIIKNVKFELNHKKLFNLIAELDLLFDSISYEDVFTNTFTRIPIFGSHPYIKSKYIRIVDILTTLSDVNKKQINLCEIGAGKGIVSLKYITAFHLLDIEYVGDFYEIDDLFIEIFNNLFNEIQNINVLKEDILLVDYSKYDYIYSYTPFNEPIFEYLLERRVFLTAKKLSVINFYNWSHFLMSILNSDDSKFKLRGKIHSVFCSENIIQFLKSDLFFRNRLLEIQNTNYSDYDYSKTSDLFIDFEFKLKFDLLLNYDIKNLKPLNSKDIYEIFNRELDNFLELSLTETIDIKNFILESKNIRWIVKLILLEFDKYSVPLQIYKDGSFQKI